jgi:hypothetical protein
MPSHLRAKLAHEHRRDEESLYFILERDLASGALFPYNNAWFSQVSTKGNRLDFVVQYRDKLLGVEVKFDFPRLDDFGQADRYRKVVDAVYLAFPSDRAGEALYLSETKRKYPDIGLISVALFRTYCIRRALYERRKSNVIWSSDYFFDEKAHKKWYQEEHKKENLSSLERHLLSILKERKFYSSISKHGQLDSENVYDFSLPKREWQGLALLYALTKVKGFNSIHTQRDLTDLGKELNWDWYFDLSMFSGLLNRTDYGTNLSAWFYTEEAFVFESELVNALKKVIGVRQYGKLMATVDKRSIEFLDNQKKVLKDVLSFS